jgi:chromosome segregation ATPase
MDADDERGQIKEAYQQETEVTSKLAQLDRSDELIRKQLHLIEQKIDGLEQMRQPLLKKLEHHRQTREILLKNQ